MQINRKTQERINKYGLVAAVAIVFIAIVFTSLTGSSPPFADAQSRHHRSEDAPEVDSSETTTPPSVQISFETTPPSEVIANDGTCQNSTEGAPDWDAHERCLHSLTPEMQDKFVEVRDRFMQATGNKLYIVFGYRSLASQAQIYRECRTFDEIEAAARELKIEDNRPDLASILRFVGRNPDSGDCAQPTQAMPGAGAHSYGVAWDAYPVRNGQLVSDGGDPLFQTYGRAVIESGLGWGGNFGANGHCPSDGQAALDCPGFGTGWDMGHAQEPGFSGTAAIRDNRPLYQPEGIDVSPMAVVENFDNDMGEFLDQYGKDAESGESRDFDTIDEEAGAIGRWQIPEDNWGDWARNVGLPADAEPTEDNQKLIMRGHLAYLFSRFGDWQEVANEWFTELLEGNLDLAPATPTPGGCVASGEVYEAELERFKNAITQNESATVGLYEAHNDDTGAHGRYQIMPENWPNWAQEAGLPADASQTPENQERVAGHKMTGYYAQFCNWRDVAIAWFAGPGSVGDSDLDTQNDGISTVTHYADLVVQHMAASAPATPSTTTSTTVVDTTTSSSSSSSSSTTSTTGG